MSGISIEAVDESTDYTQLMAERERALDAQVDRIIEQKNTPSARTASAPQASTTQAAKRPISGLSVDLNTLSFNTLNDFNTFIQDWKGFGLCKTASKAVLGTGQTNKPALVIIADFPDDSEDRSGNAFSSPIHEMILQAAQYAGIAKESCYMTYLSKWRPPARRALASHEMDICAHLLHQELGFIAPERVLLLGESCLKAFDPDSASKSMAETLGKTYNKHIFNKLVMISSSHRGEFLVKNSSMKRMLWNSLLDIAVATRAQSNNA